jgi:L-2-hydroxyglutarate oxidase LhgO
MLKAIKKFILDDFTWIWRSNNLRLLSIRLRKSIMERIDCVVVGAGVVGLAIASRLAQAGREVIVLEAVNAIGTGTSSRNSEVIHAGIYYTKNSLKARLCVRGKEALYAYCDSRSIPYRRCGKLIVATAPSQIGELHALRGKAEGNGVFDLQWLSEAEVKQIEPDIHCLAALRSPSTGIIDSHALMLSLQGDAENAGATFAFESALAGGDITRDGIVLRVNASDEEWIANTVINCAGLQAQNVASLLTGLPKATIPPNHYAKGDYFAYSGRANFSHLIYPVPEVGGLGVHLTLDLAGRPRFGPDVEWISAIGYEIDPQKAESFYAEIRKYWPAIGAGTLHPDYAGIRPKLASRTEPAADFRIDGRALHGIPGLINLYGIESPGLTASLAIAEYVEKLLTQ